MSKLLVSLLCSFTILSGVSKADGVLLPEFEPLAFDFVHATDYERQRYLNSFFQETFGSEFPSIKNVKILVMDILGVIEIVCFRFIGVCDIRISPLLLIEISSRNELIVALGHEVGHIVHHMPILLSDTPKDLGTFLEREIVADEYATKLIPYGSCYLAKALSKAYEIAKKNYQSLPDEDTVVATTRLTHLQKLCTNEVQHK